MNSYFFSVAGEFMIIVAYCAFLNIQDILRKNYAQFVDQINRDTGKIDESILQNSDRNVSNINKTDGNGYTINMQQAMSASKFSHFFISKINLPYIP